MKYLPYFYKFISFIYTMIAAILIVTGTVVITILKIMVKFFFVWLLSFGFLFFFSRRE